MYAPKRLVIGLALIAALAWPAFAQEGRTRATAQLRITATIFQPAVIWQRISDAESMGEREVEVSVSAGGFAGNTSSNSSVTRMGTQSQTIMFDIPQAGRIEETSRRSIGDCSDFGAEGPCVLMTKTVVASDHP